MYSQVLIILTSPQCSFYFPFSYASHCVSSAAFNLISHSKNYILEFYKLKAKTTHTSTQMSLDAKAPPDFLLLFSWASV